jgi:hypothetical protein
MVVGVAGFMVFGKAVPTGEWGGRGEFYPPLPMKEGMAAGGEVRQGGMAATAAATAASGPATKP